MNDSTSMATANFFDPDAWCGLDLAGHRKLLANELTDRLGAGLGIREVMIESGPVARPYDLTVLVETDVGRLRTHLWSHDQAVIFCDPAIHPANRKQIGPDLAVTAAATRLKLRLRVPYDLEPRGLVIRLQPEPGVTRTWTAEHSRFRRKTAVTREDVVEKADDLDVRDLLAHFYVGPSLRLVSGAGEAFLLPEAVEVEGRLVTLCRHCEHWSEGSHPTCPNCRAEPVETVLASRPPKRR